MITNSDVILAEASRTKELYGVQMVLSDRNGVILAMIVATSD